ncbi:MAG: PadR family transcriptional regulator [Gemmatimonadota bacterium]|jgi:PadR family transcriptional regulator PadR
MEVGRHEARGEVMARMELMQGTLDLLVLRTLTGEPRHGYQIARAIKRLSAEALQVEEGALYPALHRLRAKGWIEGEWGMSENNRRARFYALTPEGRSALESARADWARYVDAVERVLGGEQAP